MRAHAAGALLVLFAAGCGTTHSLSHPARLPAPRAACTIGVGPLADEQGVDFALDLRDYLREHGPCRTVRAVTSPDDDTVDVVVSGKITAAIHPPGPPAGERTATVALALGIGSLVPGAVFFAMGSKSPTPDAKGFVSPSDRSTQTTFSKMGTVLMGTGAVLTTLGLVGAVIDGTVTREVTLEGVVDVDVTFTRRGAPADQVREHDEVTARAKHPSDRPEGRATPAAAGPLYRELMARAFEHVAARLGDSVEAGNVSGAP